MGFLISKCELNTNNNSQFSNLFYIIFSTQVKFEGVRGLSYQGDIAIDAISFTPGRCSLKTPKPTLQSTQTPTKPSLVQTGNAKLKKIEIQ